MHKGAYEKINKPKKRRKKIQRKMVLNFQQMN